MNPNASREIPGKQGRLEGWLGPRIEPNHPLEARGARRPLLVIPALLQLFMAFVLVVTSLEDSSQRLVFWSLALLLLLGAIGIFSRRARLFQIGLVCSVLGFSLPFLIQALSVPVDKDYSHFPGIGTYDAEGLGFIIALRLIVELPFWLLYAGIVVVRLVRKYRTTPIS